MVKLESSSPRKRLIAALELSHLVVMILGLSLLVEKLDWRLQRKIKVIFRIVYSLSTLRRTSCFESCQLIVNLDKDAIIYLFLTKRDSRCAVAKVQTKGRTVCICKGIGGGEGTHPKVDGSGWEPPTEIALFMVGKGCRESCNLSGSSWKYTANEKIIYNKTRK